MRIGYAECDITPPNGTELAGYGYFLNRRSTGVEMPLIASALTLDDGNQLAAVCAADVVGVTPEATQHIQDAIQARLDRPFTLLLNASHTHGGPATRPLYGAGGYNQDYVDTQLVPTLVRAIIQSHQTDSEGEIGIGRTRVDDVSHNRTHGNHLDSRLSVVLASTERRTINGLHFPCHPNVYKDKNTLVSPDFPGFARLLTQNWMTENDRTFWLTGCAGNIEPNTMASTAAGRTEFQTAKDIGARLAERAAEERANVAAQQGLLRVLQTTISLPINTEFTLNPAHETEVYRRVRNKAETQDLSYYKDWLSSFEGLINTGTDREVPIALTVIGIGRLAFVGFGAEIFSDTASRLETALPELTIVSTMTTNGHEGYVPPAEQYMYDDYAPRQSAILFGRKPLRPNSESILLDQATQAIRGLWAA